MHNAFSDSRFLLTFIVYIPQVDLCWWCVVQCSFGLDVESYSADDAIPRSLYFTW